MRPIAGQHGDQRKTGKMQFEVNKEATLSLEAAAVGNSFGQIFYRSRLGYLKWRARAGPQPRAFLPDPGRLK